MSQTHFCANIWCVCHCVTYRGTWGLRHVSINKTTDDLARYHTWSRSFVFDRFFWRIHAYFEDDDHGHCSADPNSRSSVKQSNIFPHLLDTLEYSRKDFWHRGFSVLLLDSSHFTQFDFVSNCILNCDLEMHFAYQLSIFLVNLVIQSHRIWLYHLCLIKNW